MALLNPQGLSETEWLAQLKTIQGNLNATEKVKIVLSNSLWIRDSFADQVKSDFLTRNKDYFGAMIATADFNKAQAVDDINAWVKKNTNNMIEKVIDGIDPSTIMFLINTIYFKGSWLSPFEAKATQDALFHGSVDKTVKFMSQIGSFKVSETDDYQAILMPYEGNTTGMLIVMGKNDPLVIDSDLAFQNVMASLQNTSVKIQMPKVDIATSMILNDKLSGLGLTDPFIAGVADFSRLSDAELFISKVLHKTHLKIDEKGTEAAAATTVIIDVTSMPTYDHEIVIDHPFQAYIVDLENNLILFSGLLNDVQATE
jgi:serpin B